MIRLNGYQEMREHLGKEFGVTEWHEVTQADINRFADVTGDHQWIHTDPERAAATPFGGTIAHGLYTLSLGPRFCSELFALDGFAFGMNYGYNKVRYPAPVLIGSKLRMRATLTDLTEVAGGYQVVVTATFECDGIDKPVCVAEMLYRLQSLPTDAT